jgi:hypothetical protein
MLKINFKYFLESEEKSNLEKTISRLPKKHRELIHNYKFKYKDKTTLDKKNVGLLCGDKIEIAGGWNYSKEFVTLHEVGHVVWEKLSSSEKHKWKDLLSRTIDDQKKKADKISKSSLNQNPEEIFAMTYACAYSKHPSHYFYNKKWIKFVKSI